MKVAGPINYRLFQEGPLTYIAYVRDGRLVQVLHRTRDAALAELRAVGIHAKEVGHGPS